jgi:ABC-type multidrug transport system ATPase subunit
VIVLKNGEIIAQGKYEELKEKGIDFSEFILKRGDEIEDDNDYVEKKDSKNKENLSYCEIPKRKKKKNEKLKENEEYEVNCAKELEGCEDSVGTQIMTEEEQSTSCFLSNFNLCGFFFNF